MRLTLRTMLAYLDDILEPVDADQLGQKIEESKFASDLVHRIRNSTRRLRLGAPRLEGKGMGLDPNTVAEYLDNTLRPEHVPDFEKVCLESDVHLAEVASSHQILTLVLGEPADIEHAVRERVYRLDRMAVDTQAESDPEAAEAETTPQVGAVKAQQVSPPPDYMRGGSGVRLRSLAITLVLTFLAVALGLRAMGSFDRNHFVWRAMFGGADQVAESSATTPVAGQAPSEPQDSQAEESASAIDEARDSSAASSSAALSPPETLSPEPENSPDAGTVAPTVAIDPNRSAPALEPPDTTAAPIPEITSDAERITIAAKPLLEPGDSTSAEPPSSEPLSVDHSVAAASGASEASPDGTGVDAGAEVESAAITTATSVGRYFSDNQVLGRLDPESGEWFSLPADAVLAAGNELVVLPTYRPQILLSPGMKVTLSGESRINLLPLGTDGSPQLDIVYGRAIIVPVGDVGARISLQFAARKAALQFDDMESAAAIEVRRFLPPGSDPETTTAQDVVLVYAIGGQITWQEEKSNIQLNAGQLLAFAGADDGRMLENATLPSWFDGNQLRPIERRGSKGLRDHITPDRPLGLALMERTDFRKQEERALACRALTALDIFDPLLKALDDEAQKAHWRSHFNTLRSAVSRSRETAMRLREMIEKLYGDQAADIYRLCWGFSSEQLPAGAAEQLVEHLASETMCVRVLAIWNLEQITGMTLFFLARQTPDQERTKIARWRQSLHEGRIVYSQPPSPIPELPAPVETATAVE